MENCGVEWRSNLSVAKKELRTQTGSEFFCLSCTKKNWVKTEDFK